MKGLLAVFLLGLAASSSALEYHPETRGYRDLVVTISPDIEDSEGQSVVDGIKEWISSGSEQLWKATKHLGYIEHVRILIPDHWTSVEATETGDVFMEDGNIVVGQENPIYMGLPNAVQTGGCRERGERIDVSPQFLTRLDFFPTHGIYRGFRK